MRLLDQLSMISIVGQRLFRTCRVCGDRIGVYESVVVVDDGRERSTSLAREPELEDDLGPSLVHAVCAGGLVMRHSRAT